MNKPINTNYPFTVWIRSILLGSAGMLISFIFYIGTGSFDTYMKFIFVTIFMASILSWLTFLLCYLIFKRLIDTTISRKKIKIIMCCLAIAGMLSTCSLFEIDLLEINEETIVPASFLAGIIVATWRTKIENPVIPSSHH